jgi:cytochrome bd-type quinol oxidase subunit 2
MDTSLYLARLIGPMLLVVGLSVLINRENFRTMAKEIVASPEMMFMIGLLMLLGGLAIIIAHNVWSGWPTIITVFGWLFAIGGAARILFPDAVRSLQSAALDKPAMPLIGGTVQAILGAWLCYAGYLA